MKKLTNQELFDNAACGIISQGCKPCMDDVEEGCVVLNSEGARCAIGWSVTDARSGSIGTKQWEMLCKSEIAQHLRKAHDDVLVLRGFAAWQERMSTLALIYNLDDSCVYWKKKA